MIADYQAFLPHKRLVTVDLRDGRRKQYNLKLNIPTGDYLKIISCFNAIYQTDNETQKEDYLLMCVVTILGESKDWIINNITIKNQMALVKAVLGYLNEIMSSKAFEIPKINVNTKKINKDDKDAREKAKRQFKMEQMEKQLAEYGDTDLMQDICILTENTSNSYEDILKMPVLAYRALLKTICVNKLNQNEEWHFEWLKRKTNEIKDKIIKDEKAEVNQTSNKRKGADVSKLKALL